MFTEIKAQRVWCGFPDTPCIHTYIYIYTICICRFVADIDEMGFYWLRHATHVGVGYILCNCCCLPQFERHCKWSWKKTKSERSARNESTNWKTIAYQAPLNIKYINSVNYCLISCQLALKGNFCLFSILFLSLFFYVFLCVITFLNCYSL